MADTRIDEIKSRVTIPTYFYTIIVPKMSEYYSDYKVDFDIRPVCKCPIHSEDTPSMRYYEETNTFYCFGCGAGGDVIELHRRFIEQESGTKPTFGESINFLYDYFILGKSGVTLLKPTKKGRYKSPDIIESSNIELMSYNRYAQTLDLQMQQDECLDFSIKVDIWNTLDSLRILIDKKKINALEAKEYLIVYVKEKMLNSKGE